MKLIARDFAAAFLLGFALPMLLLGLAAGHYEEGRMHPEENEIHPEEILQDSGNYLWMIREDCLEYMDLEAYIVGVVLAEMPVEFETEALKAQAVASRTYARKAWETGGKHGDGSICADPSCCQAYLEPEEYIRRGGTSQGVEKVRSAVHDTAGLVLTYEDILIEATYFSCSGGKTEAAVEVWGREYPYLQSVESPGEERAAHYRDTVFYSPEELASLLDIHTDEQPDNWIRLMEYTPGGSVRKLAIADRIFTGTQLRSLLGLRSAAFDLELTESGFRITTRGYGHRVGMSQYGAEAMAVSGSSFQEILAHYYPGTELFHLPPDDGILYHPRKT